MSHFKERSEKNCLNCNAEVQGRYCHVCGQENVEPKETAWHLVTHFFNDITHFDGKFFQTLKYLIWKPGFISKEYMVGKRASYLNPIRMYVFTSAIFFLIFFSVTHFDEKSVKQTYEGHSLSEIAAMDSSEFTEFTKELNDGKPLTREQFKIFADTTKNGSGFQFSPRSYKNKAEYDSVLKAGKDHNWLERMLTYKQIELNEKYGNNRSKFLAGFVNGFLHSFPQMLFVSLPLFALFLKLLYIRRKQFYYTNHVIFSVHLYVFIFILLLFLIGLRELKEALDWSWLKYLNIAGVIFIFYYVYKAMRNFYLQSRVKTILKFLLLNFMMFFLILFLFVVFAFFSILKM